MASEQTKASQSTPHVPAGEPTSQLPDVVVGLLHSIRSYGYAYKDRDENLACKWIGQIERDLRAALATPRAPEPAAPVAHGAKDAQYTEGWNDGFNAAKLRLDLAAPTAAPVAQEPVATFNRARVMADEVMAELQAADSAWNEEDIDRIQSSLLPRVYDCLNLLALAAPTAAQGLTDAEIDAVGDSVGLYVPKRREFARAILAAKETRQ